MTTLLSTHIYAPVTLYWFTTRLSASAMDFETVLLATQLVSLLHYLTLWDSKFFVRIAVIKYLNVFLATTETLSVNTSILRTIFKEETYNWNQILAKIFYKNQGTLRWLPNWTLWYITWFSATFFAVALLAMQLIFRQPIFWWSLRTQLHYLSLRISDGCYNSIANCAVDLSVALPDFSR